MIPLSSGSFSVDQQLEDVVAWLDAERPDDHARFLEEFPEWEQRRWQGPHSGHFDTTTMGVDEEWSSWAIDWVENHTDVTWEDGEPYLVELTDTSEDEW